MNMSGPKTRLINNIWGVCVWHSREVTATSHSQCFSTCVFMCVCEGDRNSARARVRQSIQTETEGKEREKRRESVK